ncbi:hypothetical protein L6164_000114 [Bauhinia variegata]|uniref:Uncharacterized protein n=1 Tax=Bauhinia variegata TaxID=167791 RepID=A0ACB9Q5I5_BAUVA|nr:hypothetical protein L6164_000114 [Bauhinia variegata]
MSILFTCIEIPSETSAEPGIKNILLLVLELKVCITNKCGFRRIYNCLITCFHIIDWQQLLGCGVVRHCCL